MHKRLSLREKLAYGVADLGAALTYVGINTWLLYFLINIVKLEPLLAGIVFVAGRVVDAVLDPIMGVWSDKLKPKFGRKPFIMWGAIPLGLSFALLWLAPEGSQFLKFSVALVLLTLFSAVYTFVQIPYMSLTPEIASDYDERTSLTSFRMGFGTFASLIAVALPPILVSRFSGAAELGQSNALSWLYMGLIFGVIAATSYLLMASQVREPKMEHSAPVTPNTRSFIQEARSAFSIYGFASVFSLFVTITIGMMIINSILPFFLESNLRISADQQSVVLGSLFGMAILAFPVWNLIANKLGKRLSLSLGLVILASASTLLVLFSPSGSLSAYLMIMALIAGFGLSSVTLFPWAMLPDVVEFDELNTGRRREGLVYALFTFGQKMASSIGVFANAMVAAFFGYQQGLSEQTPETLRAIAWMAGPVAAAVLLIAIIIVWQFPITKAKHEAVKAQLQKGQALP